MIRASGRGQEHTPFDRDLLGGSRSRQPLAEGSDTGDGSGHIFDLARTDARCASTSRASILSITSE